MFQVQNTKITSLEGGPAQVKYSYWCEHNQLSTLRGAPKTIDGTFSCNDNKLTTLEGAPERITNNFWCSDNNLTSLRGSPREVGGYYGCVRNKLTSLEGVHRYVKKVENKFIATGNPIKSHVLGILLVQCDELEIDNLEVSKIINNYLPNREGMKGLLRCQRELIKARYEEYAQL